MSGATAHDLDPLHPYDGKTRRFTHTDPDPGPGRRLVERLLHLDTVEAEGLEYDLSFYSGGMGVIDQLAISLPADESFAQRIAHGLGASTPEDAVADEIWVDDFLWLTHREDDVTTLDRAEVAAFLDGERAPFQPPCTADCPIWVASHSNVNDWEAVWLADGRLAYLGYSQG